MTESPAAQPLEAHPLEYWVVFCGSTAYGVASTARAAMEETLRQIAEFERSESGEWTDETSTEVILRSHIVRFSVERGGVEALRVLLLDNLALTEAELPEELRVH